MLEILTTPTCVVKLYNTLLQNTALAGLEIQEGPHSALARVSVKNNQIRKINPRLSME